MAEKDLIKERLKKLENLKKEGINPYPHIYKPDTKISYIFDKFSKLKKHEMSGKKVKIAGRIRAIRGMGKVAFIEIEDFTGKIQAFLKKDDLKKQFGIYKNSDLGDFVAIEGEVFKTKTGEISVWAKNYIMLTKSTRPLPEKFHGLKDPEVRYRKRYLDMISNPEVKKVFVVRSKILSLIREFLDKKGFIEVQTPILQPLYGGANARPFKTHHNALNFDIYLRISPELYLKRLIVGGMEKVYELGNTFRNEGMDKTHNPEFTMLELYQAYADYNDMMELTEKMYEFVAKKLFGTTKIKYQGKTIDFKTPWKRMTMKGAIKKYAKIDIDKLSDKELLDVMRGYNVEYEEDFNRGIATQLIFEELVEDKLIQPVFITDHPKESTPLCKIHRKDSELIERFEPFVNGWEIGNAYTELNDPIHQKKVLKEQVETRVLEEKHPVDEDFIEALETGMPPTGGLGLGIDRMIMFFTNSETIRDVILFPTMKPKKE